MSSWFSTRVAIVSAVLLFLATPSAVYAAYTSTLVGTTATMTGDANGDILTITQAGGLFQHNRFAAGDLGFFSAFDFDSVLAGDQTVSATTGIINIDAGDGNDTIALGDGINIRGSIDGGPGTDTIDYSAYTTAVTANLGLGATGTTDTLGADQENPPTGTAATGTATVANYNIVTHTFDITVTVVGITPAEVTGFHIHQGVVGVNGPIIVDFMPFVPFTPVGTGFTFTMAGLTLPAVNEAAFLGGGTYINVHTAVFPDGAIRGQLYGGNVNLSVGASTGTAGLLGAGGITNIENVTGGTGNDSLVGNSAVNTINGGAGADWIVGGPGNDVLNGGAGADVLMWKFGDDTDLDEGGTESDIVQVSGEVIPDVFTITANGTRLRFDRTNFNLFSLDIGTVETLIVNGRGGADTFTVGDLTGVAALTTLNLNGGDGDDTFIPAAAAAFVFSAKGGPGTDTIDYSAYTTAVTANLGLNTTGLAATLGADQENPATTHAATGTAAVTNYNIVTHTFDIDVTVTGIMPAEVTGFHIHQGVVGVNGPIIVDFVPLGGLTPVGTGFTFTMTGLLLPAASEAAFLGGGTYVNVHTAVFPGGAIRGQLFSGGNVNLGLGVGTGTLGPAGAGGLANIENVTGGSGNDSLVGSFGVNTINGGAGADWIVGGPGNDILNGGAGADVLVWSNGDGTDVDEGGTESDTVQVNGSTAAADLFVVSANGTRLRFDRTNLGLFSLDIGTVETLIVNGIGGDDGFIVNNLTGVASLTTQRLNGFDGIDNFSVKASPTAGVVVRGGAGTDILNYDAELRFVTGDTTAPDGVINSPGVQGVTLTQTEAVNVLNPHLPIAIGGDFDGDRKGDVVVFRNSSGTWFTLSSSTGFTVGTSKAFGLNGDLPVAGDYDGDGKNDLAVFRPANGTWYILPSSTATQVWYVLGLGTDIPVPGDYDGDRKTDPAVYRPSTGVWSVLTSGSNYTTTRTITLGVHTDIPVPADYDGDGITDAAVYHPSTGVWTTRTAVSAFITGVTFQWGLLGDLPVPGDFDGDAIADLAVYRPSTGVWFLRQSSTGNTTFASFQFGLNTDTAVPGDFDGDGKTDLAVFRPSTGTWYIAQSTTGYTTSVSYQFGLTGDGPAPDAPLANAIAFSRRTVANSMRTADLDSDGRADLNVYRPSSGTWFNLRSGSNYTAFATFQWGLPGDIPVSSDYDHDGTTDVAVWRPSTGTWFLRDSSTGFATSRSFQWGLPGDLPVAADYDGDGAADLALWRPSSGTWFIRLSSSNYVTSVSFQWGLNGDVPVPGDYDGDGITDLGVWRPSTGTWYIRTSTTGYATSVAFQWGLEEDLPVPGDYDGDGKTDLAVWRPSIGTWLIRSSITAYASSTAVQWGLDGDIPVPADFDGDGKTDLVVYRPASGTWLLVKSGANFFNVIAIYQWGLAGDIPILEPR